MLHLYFTMHQEGVVARSLCTVWRPAIRRKEGARVLIVLLPRESGKPLRPQTLLEAHPLAQWCVTGRRPCTYVFLGRGALC